MMFCTFLFIVVLPLGQTAWHMFTQNEAYRQIEECNGILSPRLFYEGPYLHPPRPLKLLEDGTAESPEPLRIRPSQWSLYNPPVELVVREEPGGRILDANRLASVRHLPHLRRALFPPMKNADLVVDWLGSARHLEDLDLTNSDVSDASMKKLRDLTGLKELQLRKTRVTTAGVQMLRDHPNLEFLDLSRCAVNANIIDVLETMPKLEWVFLDRTEFSAMNIEELKSRLPDLVIWWDPPADY